jgi:hypothetical protein
VPLRKPHHKPCSALDSGGAGPGGGLDLEGFRRAAARAPAIKTLLTGLLSRTGLGRQQGAVFVGPSSQQQRQQQQPATAGGADGGPTASSSGGSSGGSSGALSHLLELPGLVTQAGPGGVRPAPHHTQQQRPAAGLPRDSLLQPEWVWLLAPALPPALRREWRLLFSSARHGASFNTFVARLGEAAPTLLLLRDGGGNVFGGVAHAPWRRSGAFFGEAGDSVSMPPAPTTPLASPMQRWQRGLARPLARRPLRGRQHGHGWPRGIAPRPRPPGRPALRPAPPIPGPHTPAGDYANALVSLLPAARIYPASGINANMQW